MQNTKSFYWRHLWKNIRANSGSGTAFAFGEICNIRPAGGGLQEGTGDVRGRWCRIAGRRRDALR